MKRLIVMATVLVFCLAGSVQAETRMSTWVMEPGELASINAKLLDAGHGNLIAQSGTTTIDLNYREPTNPLLTTNMPTVNDLICTDTKTNGLVRVRLIRKGHKITEVKILK